jgi:hypothetical protein
MRISHLTVFALSSVSFATPLLVPRQTPEQTSIESLLTNLFATVQIYTGAISTLAFPLIPPSTHTHTHTHTQRDREESLDITTTNNPTPPTDATLAPLTPSSSLLEKTAAIPQIGAQIVKITSAVQSTTSEIRTLAPPNATQPDTSTPSSSDSDSKSLEETTEKRSSTLTTTTESITTRISLLKRQTLAIAALLSLIIIEIFATITAAVAIVGIAGLLIYLNPLTGALSALILAVQLVLDIVLVGVIALLNALLTSLALGLSGL